MDDLEAQANKENEARRLLSKAIEALVEIGYSEEEITDEIVPEVYSEVVT